MLRFVVGSVLLLAMTLLNTSAAVAAGSAVAPDPEKPGPYAVGVTTVLLVDHSRTDAVTGGPRSLMTEIWYPATNDARRLPKNRLMDFFLQSKAPELALVFKEAFGVDMVAADRRFRNTAVRDARIRDGVYPLLLFSHGNGGMRMQNAFWCEHMASHGYIVAAPDHTGNCALTFIDGKSVIFRDGADARKQASIDRPKDLSFLIDSMNRMNLGGDSRFRGRVDTAHIGAAGHSFGGFTCTWLTNTDSRVAAAVLMAGAAEERTNFQCPVMLLVATEDKTLGKDRVDYLRRYFDESKGPHYSVEFTNAGHYSFTELYQLKPDFGDGVGKGKRVTNGEPITFLPMKTAYTLTNGYTTAFFSKYVKGMDGYDCYLRANQNPKELITKAMP